MGVGYFDEIIRLFANIVKRLRCALLFLVHFSFILFIPLLKILAQGQLRSDHQVRSSGTIFKNICDCAMTTIFKGSIWNSQKMIMASKRYISEFWFPWPVGRPVLWPGHCNSKGKCTIALYYERSMEIMLFIPRICFIKPFSMTRIQYGPHDISFGSFEVIWGQIRFFLLLTFARMKMLAPTYFSYRDASTDR